MPLLAQSEKTFATQASPDKYIYYENGRSANDFINEKHSAAFRASVEDPAAFFDKEAKKLHWFKPYKTILDTSD